MAPTIQSARGSPLLSLPVSCWLILILVSVGALRPVSGQLPDDIQRELNQNLAEQARLQALQQRQQHQRQLIQNRAGQQVQPQRQQQQQQKPAHDPNNYSYQQVSPPVQYSYYQPFGDAAAQQPGQQQQQQPQQQQQVASPANFDLNNLNFDLPQPQAQVASSLPVANAGQQQQQQQVHMTPSFTGVGGLPIMKPVAASAQPYVPVGQAPMAPQARVQQGPPLTEADFKDITGGDNYGAPGGNDFGLGDAGSTGSANSAGANGRSGGGDSTDAQLREFGLPADQSSGAGAGGNRGGNQGGQIDSSTQNMNIPDFGAFNPIGATNSRRGQAAPAQRMDLPGGFGADFGNLGGMGGGSNGAGSAGRNGRGDFGDFGNLGGMGGGSDGSSGGGSNGAGSPRRGGEFDFASLPSSSSQGDQATAAQNGGAPGSLQGLLGSGFPGLGGGSQAGSGGNGAGQEDGGGLDGFSSGTNDPQTQAQSRQSDNSMDIADLGDKSDQFSGADLGGFEQPSPSQDQDFNYAAASEQQPSSVPYPDGSPQPVGTIFAITQPQSLTQTRYNALPDKGTYQDYPAYQSEGDQSMNGVQEAVDGTPKARRPGPGRYGVPASEQLAPEYRRMRRSAGEIFDYGRMGWQGQSQLSGRQLARGQYA